MKENLHKPRKEKHILQSINFQQPKVDPVIFLRSKVIWMNEWMNFQLKIANEYDCTSASAQNKINVK